MPGRLLISAVYAISLTQTSFHVVISGPLRGVLDEMRRLGYDGVEFNIDDPFKVDLGELKREVRERGLRVSAISTGLSHLAYGINLSSPDPSVRSRSLEFFKKYIEVSRRLDSGVVVVGLARGSCKGDCSEAWRRLEESLGGLEKPALDNGVNLVIEPLNRYETNLINKVSEALRIASGFKHTRVLIDTFHTTLEERSPYHAIEEAGGRIGHVHLADTNRLAPGMGFIDWGLVISKLEGVGYEGFLSVEARPEPSLEALLETSIKTIKPLINP